MTKIKFTCKHDFCKAEYDVSEKIVKAHGYDFFTECKNCRRFRKKCPICETEHNKQGLTCSSKCANKLKEEKYFKSCGARHNLCRDSTCKQTIKDNLFEKYGVTNVFQREDVKKKIFDYYMINFGVSHNTHTDSYIINRRKNGIYVPLEDLTEYQKYRNNVISFSEYNLKLFGDEYIYENWKDDRNFFNKQIDHIYSIKNGFLYNIPPYIIGSIINMRLIPYKENLSKGSKNDITKEILMEKYNNFERKNRKIIEYKISLRKKHENKKNN